MYRVAKSIVIISVHTFFLPITNHTRRINLQIQSSYKSKVSQKYASLLYIANFSFFFFLASKTYDTVHNQSSSFSTQSTTSSLNCIIILENRSWFFFVCFFFLQYNPESSRVVFLFFFFTFLIPFLYLFYNEMVTVGKYIKTERVALLQPCGSMETINSVVILSMRFCQLATAMLSFFIYIFQTGFIYKTKIYHWSCRERTIHITWNAMSNTATESLVAHSLNRN